MTLPELIRELDEMGCQIVGGKTPAIYPPKRVEHRKRFERLREWLSHHKAALLAYYELPNPLSLRQLCVLCRRDMTDPEDHIRMEQVNPFCTRGPTQGKWEGRVMVIPPGPPCPYRGKPSTGR